MNQRERAALRRAADDADRAGRLFAARLAQVVDAHRVSAPTLSTALAIVFAGLIVDLDDCPTLYESLGFGEATDDARIDLFVDQIRAAARELRAHRDGAVH
jgi:hypothetical protein